MLTTLIRLNRSQIQIAYDLEKVISPSFKKIIESVSKFNISDTSNLFHYTYLLSKIVLINFREDKEIITIYSVFMKTIFTHWNITTKLKFALKVIFLFFKDCFAKIFHIINLYIGKKNPVV